MDKKDLTSLREAYEKIIENSMPKDEPCPCKDGKGVCKKPDCECDTCDEVMKDKKD
jgi:hypothetical protein